MPRMSPVRQRLFCSSIHLVLECTRAIQPAPPRRVESSRGRHPTSVAAPAGPPLASVSWPLHVRNHIRSSVGSCRHGDVTRSVAGCLLARCWRSGHLVVRTADSARFCRLCRLAVFRVCAPRALCGSLSGDRFPVNATKRSALVLLDLVLPGSGGIELMAQVRALPELPVIFIFAYDRPEVLGRALDAGAEDYLVKPFIGDRADGAGARRAAVPGGRGRPGSRSASWPSTTGAAAPRSPQAGPHHRARSALCARPQRWRPVLLRRLGAPRLAPR